MKYIVYLTTNTVNNKIYIGVHSTENPDKFDGYIGNGVTGNIKSPKTPFQYAVKKYGFKSFKRLTIKVFNTLEEALDLEAELVDEEFIKRNDTYNIALGGGMPPIMNKVIYQYSLEGYYIKCWNSIHEASVALNVSESSIGKAILFKRTSSGYLWSDCLLDKLDINDYSIYSPNTAIHIYDSSGIYYKSFNSMSDCLKELNCCLSNIQRALKVGYCVKGYYISTKLTTIFEKPKTERLTGLIHQYSLDGNYIQTYNSIREAEVKLGTKLKGINEAIRESNSYYKGYLWHRGDKLEKMNPYKIPNTKARRIEQYTMDGQLVKTYNTLRECRKDFPNVSKVLNGTAKHCHNFTFKYAE